MKRSREQVRARLMARAEDVVDRLLEWMEDTPEPTLTQIEEAVLDLREELRPSPSLVDSELSEAIPLIVPSLIVRWTQIVERRVSPARVVEALDVVEQVGPCLVVRVIRAVVHALAFQCTEEALHWRIVVPGPGTIHADLDTIRSQ